MSRDPENRVRVNRDDIRFQLFGKFHGVDEDAVTEVETAMVRAALGRGKDVVVDATHLEQRYINRWQKLGYRVEIQEFPERLDVLLERNANRGRVVPESVIHKMWKRHVTDAEGTLKHVATNPDNFEFRNFHQVVEHSPYKRDAIIVDIDGTVAHNDGHRSFYDYSKVSDDKPHQHVIDLVNGYEENAYVICVSGRPDSAWVDTVNWLEDHGIMYDLLFMRKAGDNRPDTVVKYEILRDKIAPYHNPIMALDDRPNVCRMWEAQGIPVVKLGKMDHEF